MTARKVWSEPGIDFEGEISPDGKYVSFCDWETGDLAIHDLESGTKRRLTDNAHWKDDGPYAYDSRWAPDGKQIAYSWYDAHGSDLRVLNVDTAKSRVLYKPSKWEMVRDLRVLDDRSPSEPRILVARLLLLPSRGAQTVAGGTDKGRQGRRPRGGKPESGSRPAALASPGYALRWKSNQSPDAAPLVEREPARRSSPGIHQTMAVF